MVVNYKSLKRDQNNLTCELKVSVFALEKSASFQTMLALSKEMSASNSCHMEVGWNVTVDLLITSIAKSKVKNMHRTFL